MGGTNQLLPLREAEFELEQSVTRNSTFVGRLWVETLLGSVKGAQEGATREKRTSCDHSAGCDVCIVFIMCIGERARMRRAR